MICKKQITDVECRCVSDLCGDGAVTLEGSELTQSACDVEPHSLDEHDVTLKIWSAGVEGFTAITAQWSKYAK